MRVGTWLLEERNKLKIQEIAKMLNVDRRTLSNWKKTAKLNLKNKIGRPRYAEQLSHSSLLKVGREWKTQGCPGWRPIKAKFKTEIPTRLIQLHLKRLKLLKRRHESQRLKKSRTSVKVKYKNIFWSQDGAEFKKTKYQIIKDRGSFKVVMASALKSETAENVIEVLEKAKKVRGLPLVLSTDNGSNYISNRFRKYLAVNKIIHLKSLPRTPQHNGSVECAIREIKEAAQSNDCSLERASKIINENRLRASFLFKTSDEIDEKMTEGYPEVKRDEFYKECMHMLKKSCVDTKNKRSMRMIERKVILETLVKFNLIEINRGRLV